MIHYPAISGEGQKALGERDIRVGGEHDPTDAESMYCWADSSQAEHQDWGTLTLREPPISHPP